MSKKKIELLVMDDEEYPRYFFAANRYLKTMSVWWTVTACKGSFKKMISVNKKIVAKKESEQVSHQQGSCSILAPPPRLAGVSHAS